MLGKPAKAWGSNPGAVWMRQKLEEQRRRRRRVGAMEKTSLAEEDDDEYNYDPVDAEEEMEILHEEAMARFGVGGGSGARRRRGATQGAVHDGQKRLEGGSAFRSRDGPRPAAPSNASRRSASEAGRKAISSRMGGGPERGGKINASSAAVSHDGSSDDDDSGPSVSAESRITVRIR